MQVRSGSFVVFALHPELRLLLPILDAVGVDMFVALLGVQLAALVSGFARFALHRVWAASAPAARGAAALVQSFAFLRGVRDFAGYAVFHWLGRPGPALWFRLLRFSRAWRAGPGAVPAAA